MAFSFQKGFIKGHSYLTVILSLHCKENSVLKNAKVTQTKWCLILALNFWDHALTLWLTHLSTNALSSSNL